MTKGIFLMFVALLAIIFGIVFFGLPVAQAPAIPIVILPTSTSSGQVTPSSTVDIIPATSPNLRNLNIGPNDLFVDPYEVTGEAKLWYFEASFPVKLLDSAGKEIRVGYGQAQGDWMTTEFVPFKVTWTIQGEPTTATGTLVLQKDNPSDLRELDESVQIPVRFETKMADVPVVSGGCVVSGCSSQVCGEEIVTTDCMYREEYACYQKAKCERGQNGQCGWTLTPDINACLEQYK
jgi:hypothetical protein